MARVFYKAVALALGALGFGGGCDRNPHVEKPAYGVPTAEYHVDGHVVSESSGEALAGIQLEFKGRVVQSDSAGAFEIKTGGEPCGNQGWAPCSLYVTDINGSDGGGHFLDTSIELNLVRTEPPYGEWNLGKYEARDLSIALQQMADSGARKSLQGHSR